MYKICYIYVMTHTSITVYIIYRYIYYNVMYHLANYMILQEVVKLSWEEFGMWRSSCSSKLLLKYLLLFHLAECTLVFEKMP